LRLCYCGSRGAVWSRAGSAQEIESWVIDCRGSLEAAIRSDVVWVNRSRAFDTARGRIGTSLTRDEPWELLERFIRSRDAPQSLPSLMRDHFEESTNLIADLMKDSDTRFPQAGSRVIRAVVVPARCCLRGQSQDLARDAAGCDQRRALADLAPVAVPLLERSCPAFGAAVLLIAALTPFLALPGNLEVALAMLALLDVFLPQDFLRE
jgi:hypothetical protein